uniref:Doublecortin-like kinase 3 n=1 Tax=Salarias fasciatus TaxID=181472 RepID=A0A672HVU5_SALFA
MSRLTSRDEDNCYDIGRVVGDGNFAVVRECRRRDSGQTLAMKIVERSKLIGREHMMQNELSLLGSLCHPRIVRLFAHHHTHTHSYLVMELVSGGDLFEAISESGKFSEAAAGLMVSDVSEALSYIHSKSIVHRDLKPENLLQAAAGVCRLKLGDFGLAMVVTEPVFTICGTPTYVAPEILCETGYGVEVDVWALGVILYILLCGFPPFRSRDRDQEELFQLIKQGQLHFPSPYWDSISEGEMCRCVFMMEHVNVKAVLKTTCVFVCRSQRPHQSFASARPHSEAGSRADPPAPLGESHGFSLQAEGAHRQKSEEHWRYKQEQNIKEINTVQIRSPQIEESTPDQEKDFGSTEKCRTHNPGLKLSNADCADLNQAHQAQIHLSPLIETQPDPPLSPLAASSSARQHEQDLTSPLHNATTAPLQ